jgi:hypothetical protein
MPLAPLSDADMPGTPETQRTVTSLERTPNRAQIHKRLLEFALQNPERVVTPALFAKAVRKWATEELKAKHELAKVGYQDLGRATSLTATTPDSTEKRAPGDVLNELDDKCVSSPSKKICIDLERSVHVPLGEYNATTAPRPILTFGDVQNGQLSHMATPHQTRGFTPINKPRLRKVESEDICKKTDVPSTFNWDEDVENPVKPGYPARQLSNITSSPASSQSYRHPGGDILTFSGKSNTQRKAAPSRLNLDLPGATATKTVNEATHYLALPSFKLPSFKGVYTINIDKLQQHIDRLQTMNRIPQAQRTMLLKTPVYNLEPDDIRDEHTPFVVKPIPRTPSSELTSAFKTTFTLATPATAQFSTAARMRHMAAAQRAQARIGDRIGTTSATGRPDAYQQERRMRRTDRILAALNSGKGSSCPMSPFSSHPRQAAKSYKSYAPFGKEKCKASFDLISAISRIPELAVAVATHLPPRDVLTLYSVSVQFHIQINTYLKSSIATWARQWAPDAANVYQCDNSGMYKHFAIRDPAGRPLTALSVLNDVNNAAKMPTEDTPNKPVERLVPSIKWYQMISLRDEIAVDILAHLARQGFRCPQGTKVSLLKMWMIMDLPTNAERRQLLRRPGAFSDQDLMYIATFFVKLTFRLNDPIYGPESADLVELMLGQKSLYSLWQMLFGYKYRDVVSLLQCKIHYDLGWEWYLGKNREFGFVDPKYLRPDAPPLLGVPGHQIGRGHLEHWGKKGVIVPALLRPTECIMEEAALRNLKLDEHLMGLVIWGHVDLTSGRNLAPSEQEIWMRDSEHKNRAIDVCVEFTPFHCRRARWGQLGEPERRRILLAQEIREENVYKWDEHRFDDPTLTPEENYEINQSLRDLRLSALGIDHKNPTFRVDREGNSISIKSPVTASISTELSGSSLKKAQDHVEDGGHESDSTVDSLEATMAVNDDRKIPYAWQPADEDHAMHAPHTASATESSQRGQHFDHTQDVKSDEGTDEGIDTNEESDEDLDTDDKSVAGDVPFEEDDESVFDDIWDMWEEMDSKVFRIFFDTESDDDL